MIVTIQIDWITAESCLTLRSAFSAGAMGVLLVLTLTQHHWPGGLLWSSFARHWAQRIRDQGQILLYQAHQVFDIFKAVDGDVRLLRDQDLERAYLQSKRENFLLNTIMQIAHQAVVFFSRCHLPAPPCIFFQV
jgi:hypothetical protein